MYNFDLLGHILSFNSKLHKHILANNPDRVKDYLCKAYDTISPANPKAHPCWDHIREGVKFLEAKGWKVGAAPWKELGKQLIIISPDGAYYHSKFKS